MRALAAALMLLAAAPADAAETQRAVIGGIERVWRLARAPGAAPQPLVVGLHGIGDNVDNFAVATGLEAAAAARGFAVVIPEGTGDGHGWNAGFCCGAALRAGLDDVGFVLALVGRTQGIDRRRVFLAGMSNGGMLAYRIAAEHPDRVAGIVAVAAAIGGTGRDGAPRYTIPRPVRPMPLMIVHGRRDPLVLYEGGVSAMLNIPGRHNASVAEALALFAQANGCATPPRPVATPPGPATLVAAEGCEAPLLAWSFEEGRHEWPATLAGRKTAEAVLDFFAGLPPAREPR